MNGLEEKNNKSQGTPGFGSCLNSFEEMYNEDELNTAGSMSNTNQGIPGGSTDNTESTYKFNESYPSQGINSPVLKPKKKFKKKVFVFMGLAVMAFFFGLLFYMSGIRQPLKSDELVTILTGVNFEDPAIKLNSTLIKNVNITKNLESRGNTQTIEADMTIGGNGMDVDVSAVIDLEYNSKTERWKCTAAKSTVNDIKKDEEALKKHITNYLADSKTGFKNKNLTSEIGGKITIDNITFENINHDFKQKFSADGEVGQTILKQPVHIEGEIDYDEEKSEWHVDKSTFKCTYTGDIEADTDTEDSTDAQLFVTRRLSGKNVKCTKQNDMYIGYVQFDLPSTGFSDITVSAESIGDNKFKISYTAVIDESGDLANIKCAGNTVLDCADETKEVIGEENTWVDDLNIKEISEEDVKRQLAYKTFDNHTISSDEAASFKESSRTYDGELFKTDMACYGTMTVDGEEISVKINLSVSTESGRNLYEWYINSVEKQ